MPNGTVTASVSVGGVAFTSRVARAATGQISHIVELPAGHAGAISAAADGGVDGLTTGHGLIVTDLVDVHWVDASGVQKCHRWREIDVANANDVEFAAAPAGEGDALPAEDYAVVIDKQVEINTDWDADDALIIVAQTTKRGAVAYLTDVPAEILGLTLPAGEAWMWASDQNIANPLTGVPVDAITVSNGEAVASRAYIGVLYESA